MGILHESYINTLLTYNIFVKKKKPSHDIILLSRYFYSSNINQYSSTVQLTWEVNGKDNYCKRKMNSLLDNTHA